jgi:hypothetical protein
LQVLIQTLPDKAVTNIVMRFLADRHNTKAMELEESGQAEKAIACYEKAISTDPKWSVPWFNLGLLYKRRKNWEQSLKCNRRAAELNPKDETAWWNLGIAATALDDWKEARRAWNAYGIKIGSGDGPLELWRQPTPIRLNPDGNGEVVWCSRIDPARAFIENIPLPESNHRYRDLLLHDGAPNGYRKLGDQEVPVFDELQLLSPSDFGTFEVFIDGAEPEALRELIDSEAEKSGNDLAIEDWGTMRRICKACSEGKPFDQTHIHESGIGGERRIGFAAKTEMRVNELLANWRRKHLEATFSEVKCVLPPAWVN